MKYNTVRSIVNNFKQNSRVNIKKKISGYCKKRKSIGDNSMQKDVANCEAFHGFETQSSQHSLNCPSVQGNQGGQSMPKVKICRKPIQTSVSIISGPQRSLDLRLYSSQCPIGLFVAQDDHSAFSIYTDQLATFSNSQY